jgi:RNA-directed DNA polymerase
VANTADVELERRPKRNKGKPALAQLCEHSHLNTAWDGLRKNPHSHGLDNVSIDAFRNNLDAELSEIRRDLLGKTYAFQKLRGVAIPKVDTDRIRPIQVPAVRDRVVAKAIAHLIEPDLKKFDHNFSFGYRAGLSRNDAIAAVHRAAASGLTWVLEADITNFFGQVDNELLFKKLFKVIGKPSIRGLVKAAVVNEIGNRDAIDPKHKESFPITGEGIPQGAILSPMLANFYLSAFDREMQHRGFEVVRYADDFVVMCETEARAKHAFVIAKGYMEGQLKLSMHDLGASKTRIVEYQGGFTFLGYDVRQGKHFPSQASIRKRLSMIDKAFEHPKGKPLLPIVIKISAVLGGWKEAYKDSEMTEAANRINAHVAACITNFFRVNGFTSDGRTVTNKQLQILGIPTI